MTPGTLRVCFLGDKLRQGQVKDRSVTGMQGREEVVSLAGRPLHTPLLSSASTLGLLGTGPQPGGSTVFL